MLFAANWIIPIVFWLYTFRLLQIGGYKLPAMFAVTWLLGFFGFPLIGIEGSLYFISFEALLSVVLIFIYLYQKQMSKRTPIQDSLKELNR